MQTHKGLRKWASLLPELALVINTTTSKALPRYTTPYEVWFGRKPHWIGPQSQESSNNSNSNTSTDTSDNDDDEEEEREDLVLTEIEQRVAQNNVRLHAQIVKANSSDTIKFVAGSVATLWIPIKIRLSTKNTRLPVRIMDYRGG